MLRSPSTLLWLLAAGGVLVLALARVHTRLAGRAAVALTLLTLPVWMLLEARLPLVSPALEWPEITGWLPLSWHVDQLGWELSGTLLLLAAGGLLFGQRFERASESKTYDTTVLVPLAALVMLLTAAGLATVWANSLAGMMKGWVALIISWVGILLLAGDNEEATRHRLLFRSGWFLLSIFFLWLAAATLPAGARQNLDMADWPRVSSSSALTAALMQMGVWPFHGWRPTKRPLAPVLCAMLHIVPALAGASLLARLAISTEISSGYALFLTAFALMGLLLGVYRIWTSGNAATAVALSLTSLALLAGVWSGYETLVTEVRVMALAVGILFFIPLSGDHRLHWWRAVAIGVALAAVSGLPMTAGFAGRTALFTALLENDRQVLAFVTGLLITLMVGTILSRVNQPNAPEEPVNLPLHVDSLPSRITKFMALAILSVGLISVGGIALGRVNPGTWLVLALTPLGGLIALRYRGAWRGAGTVLQQAFSLELPLDTLGQPLRSLSRKLTATVREGADVLESEGGLLWVLILVAVLLLFT